MAESLRLPGWSTAERPELVVTARSSIVKGRAMNLLRPGDEARYYLEQSWSLMLGKNFREYFQWAKCLAE